MAGRQRRAQLLRPVATIMTAVGKSPMWQIRREVAGPAPATHRGGTLAQRKTGSCAMCVKRPAHGAHSGDGRGWWAGSEVVGQRCAAGQAGHVPACKSCCSGMLRCVVVMSM